MRRWSLILLLVIVASVAFAVSFQASQSRGGGGSPQGWTGTPPSPEAPLEPKAPATVKEGETWVPPLPAMELVAPPAGWVTSGPDVPPMPLTLLRLPRTKITRARFPAIDFHVHASGLTNVAAYQSLITLMDSIGMGAIANMNGGTGQALDAALKAGEAYRDRVATFITFSPDGINEPGWSQRFAAEMERAFKSGVLGMKVHKTLGQSARNPDGSFIQADDPRLDPIWEMAARYAKPIMIHMSDSIGRFYPIGPKNERYEAGLWRRPGDISENLYRDGPRPDVIEKARENMHRKHPKTHFVNAHMAMLYYDPQKLAAFLDTYPNADVEISATLQDLGRAHGYGGSSSSSTRIACSWGPTAIRAAEPTSSGSRIGAISKPTTSTSIIRRRSGRPEARPGTGAGTSPASGFQIRCSAKSITRMRSGTYRRCGRLSKSSSRDANSASKRPTRSIWST